MREALVQERGELAQAQDLFQSQKDEFREERQTLAEWIAERDEALRRWEEKLSRDSESIGSRDAAWRSIRDRWMQEKIQGEQIIRDLLRQLTDLSDIATGGGHDLLGTSAEATAAEPAPSHPLPESLPGPETDPTEYPEDEYLDPRD